MRTYPELLLRRHARDIRVYPTQVVPLKSIPEGNRQVSNMTSSHAPKSTVGFRDYSLDILNDSHAPDPNHTAICMLPGLKRS